MAVDGYGKIYITVRERRTAAVSFPSPPTPKASLGLRQNNNRQKEQPLAEVERHLTQDGRWC